MDPKENVTNNAQGNPLSTKSQVLETGAAAAQVFYTLSGPIFVFIIEEKTADTSGITEFCSSETDLCPP